jgi:hypothetical protein
LTPPDHPTRLRSESYPVSDEAKRPNEFRRYRQVLAGVYLTLAASVAILLAASVVKELFFRRAGAEVAKAAPVPRPAVAELLECHRMVLDLFDGLGRETGELLARPLKTEVQHGELASRWEDISRAWRDAWDVAEVRCRFSALAETEMGVPFERLAKVHGGLPAMRLKYQALLVRFDDEQADDLARMRRDLDRSRHELEELAGAETIPDAPAR